MQTPDVDLDKECRNCLHRKTGWVCENPQSSHFEQQVSSEETCEHFVASPAQAHFVRALTNTMFMLKANNAVQREQGMHEVVDHYTAAIATGLPKEDEIQARLGIAVAYAHAIGHQIQATGNEKLLQSEELNRALLEVRTSGELEKQYHLNEISTIWHQLAKVDALIAYRASVIQRDQSTEDSEHFIREHLKAFEHIVPTVLPTTLLLLGKYLMRQGKNGAAADCFRNVLSSLSRKEAAFIGNAEKRKLEAKSLLEEISGPKTEPPAYTGATAHKPDTMSSDPPKSGCFIATAVYGSEFAPEVIVLKRFRNEVLLVSKASRFLVAFYYRVSPPLANLITSHQWLNTPIRLFLIVPALKVARLLLRTTSQGVGSGD